MDCSASSRIIHYTLSSRAACHSLKSSMVGKLPNAFYKVQVLRFRGEVKFKIVLAKSAGLRLDQKNLFENLLDGVLGQRIRFQASC